MSMSPQELVLELDADIVSIASGVARTYPSTVDKDDVIQELRLYVMLQAKWLEQYDTKVQRSILRRTAHQVCEKEKLDAEHFSGQYWYTKDEVRELVVDYVLGDDLPSDGPDAQVAVERDELGRIVDIDVEHNALAGVEERVDIETALRLLGPEGRDKIRDYLTAHPRPDNKSAEYRSYLRTLDKLTELMNGKR